MIWQLTQNKEWNALEKQFSWVTDMRYVDQHRIHHAEGNVSIHTQMVIEQLLKSDEYQKLDKQSQEILWASALLHDVEKRSTSVDEGNGIISANGHARRGEYTARSLLFREIPTPFYIREQIASLVRFHGLPLWLMEKPDPLKQVAGVALRSNTKHLKLLAEADARGRICDDLDALLYSLDMFELFCKEQNCWGVSREFANPSARFHYFNTDDSYIDYVPFDNFKCEVTMLSGLPGMGKDHYIQTLGKETPVVSLDAVRRKHKISPTDKSGNGWVVQTAKEEARTYLREGQDFVWNATNITQQMRSQLIDLFVSYGAKVKIVYVEKPYSVWLNQNKNRYYPLPESVLDKMLAKLEIPQLTEAHEVKYIVDK